LFLQSRSLRFHRLVGLGRLFLVHLAASHVVVLHHGTNVSRLEGATVDLRVRKRRRQFKKIPSDTIGLLRI
jgi:hypothetical protein